MRPVSVFALLLLFLSGAALALGTFDPSQFLAANETNSSITKEFFTLNSTVYYIVNISGSPTFLVRADMLVLEKGEIEAALKGYYTQKYSLSPNETSALKTDFLTYNASRNDGQRFKNQEEDACRKALFLHLYPCTNETTCYKTAQLVCAGYAQTTGCNDPNMFLPHIINFSNASDTTQSIMQSIFAMFGTMDADNVVEYIQQMKKDIPILKSAKEGIEKTIFRYPLSGEKCTTCYAICPDLDLDDAALTRAESKLNTLSAKVAPLANYKDTAKKIYDNTQYRISENEKAGQRAYYYSLYDELNKNAVQVEGNASYALSLVDNSTVRVKLERLSALEAEIQAMINASNFTAINETLAEYNATMGALIASISPLLETYGRVSNASGEAAVYIFVAEGKPLGSDDLRVLSTMKGKKTVLDQQFKPGLTATQYADLESKYLALAAEAKDFVSKRSSFQGFYDFAGAASGKLVKGFDEVVSQARPFTYSERLLYSKYIPAAASVLVFLSFTSLVLFVFVFYYGASTKPLSRILLVIFSVLFVFLIGLISMSVYLSLDRGYLHLEYHDFISAAKSAGNLTIVVNREGADAQTLAAMRTCASSVASSLSKKNVSARIYELGGTTCYPLNSAAPAQSSQANSTNSTNAAGAVQNCLDSLGSGPLMILNPSLVPSASYSGLLVSQAVISGGSPDYATCIAAEAIDVVG